MTVNFPYRQAADFPDGVAAAPFELDFERAELEHLKWLIHGLRPHFKMIQQCRAVAARILKTKPPSKWSDADILNWAIRRKFYFDELDRDEFWIIPGGDTQIPTADDWDGEKGIRWQLHPGDDK